MIIDILCEKFNLNKNTLAKSSWNNKSGFTIGQLLEALLATDNMSDAANYLGYSTRDPIKDAIKKHLNIIEKHGGKNCKWKVVLLNHAGLHTCSYCKKVLPIIDFGKSNTRDIGIQAYCKSCSFISSKYRKKYIKERTPTWADIDKIDDIYRKCPVGYHVDHIIPLRGKNISGLHVENNLQYLLAEDNMRKSNNFAA